MVVHNYHSQALVQTEKVGSHTAVGAFSRIHPAAEIGRGCRIGDHCSIENYVRVGDNVSIGHGTIVRSNVTIEKGVRIGSRVTFIEDISHRAQVGPQESEPTLVREGAQLSDGVMVGRGLTIGHHAWVEPGSFVTKDIPDQAWVSGNPAQQEGWACECGERLDLPVKGEGEATCSCRRTYVLADGQVVESEDV